MANRKVLELQSDRIEMVLASHKAPARVTGGVVTPRAVQYHLAPAMGVKVNKLQALTDELALALGVTNVRVSRQGSSVQLEVPRDDARPVKLLPLMAQLAALPGAGAGDGKPSSYPQDTLKGYERGCAYPSRVPWGSPTPLPLFTAVLGLCDDGAPLLVRLASPDVAHVLISGTTGSGKTALCQTIILSLVMTHRRSQLQLVLVDPKRRAFAPFETLPHLLRPVIGDATKAAEALGELVRLMETRGAPIKGALGVAQRGAEVTPRIIVVLDELADLTCGANAGGKALNEHLTRLVQRGREAGIHVIACTQKPSSQVLGTLVRANFPARLVGKVVSPEDARVAAGIGGTGAERLSGRGDFLAVAAGQVVRFQAAYVSAAEMEQVVAQMGSAPRRWDVVNGRPSLLRQAATLVAGAG
jgi:S-DNA-T family DNA segregation ATPase FtsK/SpoIIIE